MKKIDKLFKEKFNSNVTQFADSIGVSRTTVSQIINRKQLPKDKFFCQLINYCEKNNLDFREYIFLKKTVKKINSNKDRNVVI
ncbi:helix-turn-helix domain-containing protein [Halonatronum saccharophilum]|uniref:helix-turn-helix domain-containing protein n=1 Tax=Halonatronum saccharophilum TaxID=150060 RepID=UPI0004801E75|nr:helix-turn-helix transcriptional regulator [Halonatronum saccharophilum]